MTDDLISRQAVLDRKYVVEVKNMWHMTEEIEVVNVDDIKALPSVNPQEPKTGHWIDMTSGYAFNDKCSKCGYIVNIQFIDEYKYCPNCGCRMVEPQESEGKE